MHHPVAQGGEERVQQDEPAQGLWAEGLHQPARHHRQHRLAQTAAHLFYVLFYYSYIILYCIVLYCIYYFILFYTILFVYWIILYYIILYYMIVYYIFHPPRRGRSCGRPSGTHSRPPPSSSGGRWRTARTPAARCLLVHIRRTRSPSAPGRARRR